MVSRPITLAIATLCVLQLHAGAATFQPVEDGLRPVYERIAAIETEVKTLETTRDGLEPQAEERAAAEEKIKTLEAEKQRLKGYVLKAKKLANSSMVTFVVPAAE